MLPAAFGRLCVETVLVSLSKSAPTPAAFGRLCVETEHHKNFGLTYAQPPSGGCVLKPARV